MECLVERGDRERVVLRSKREDDDLAVLHAVGIFTQRLSVRVELGSDDDREPVFLRESVDGDELVFLRLRERPSYADAGDTRLRLEIISSEIEREAYLRITEIHIRVARFSAGDGLKIAVKIRAFFAVFIGLSHVAETFVEIDIQIGILRQNGKKSVHCVRGYLPVGYHFACLGKKVCAFLVGKVYAAHRCRRAGLVDDNLAADFRNVPADAEQSGTTTFAGIYTAELSSPVFVEAGHDFAVVLMVYDCANGNINLFFDAGENTGRWLDNIPDNGNVRGCFFTDDNDLIDAAMFGAPRLKAFTVAAGHCRPTGFRAALNNGAVSLAWNAVKDAEAYEIWVGYDNGAYTLLTTTDTPDYSELEQYQSFDLTCVFTPENATDKLVAYGVDYPEIATVDLNGHVEANAPGIVMVYAYTRDGKFTRLFTINVTEHKHIWTAGTITKKNRPAPKPVSSPSPVRSAMR